jgi:hypothetical protein
VSFRRLLVHVTGREKLVNRILLLVWHVFFRCRRCRLHNRTGEDSSVSSCGNTTVFCVSLESRVQKPNYIISNKIDGGNMDSAFMKQGNDAY